MKMAMILYPGFTALDAIGPYEVLSRVPGMQVQCVAAQPGPITVDTGMLAVEAKSSLDELANPDILLVPGGLKERLRAMKDQALIQWVRQAHEQSTWTLSVCTGSLILGAAGVLQGLEATTHWLAKDHLARFGATYTKARMVRQGKVITAAGVSAGIDMALALAEILTDKASAESIQLALEYDPQPPRNTGSPEKASAEVLSNTQKVLAAAFAENGE